MNIDRCIAISLLNDESEGKTIGSNFKEKSLIKKFLFLFLLEVSLRSYTFLCYQWNLKN